MDKQTIDTYNESARVYDQETADFWELFPMDFINLFSQKVNGLRVLDIGSGPGRDAEILRSKNIEVTCLDASQKMLELTTEKGFISIEADLLELPFKKESFDGAWAYTSLLHVKREEVNKALAEINRVLKPKGLLGLGMQSGQGEEYKTGSNKLKGTKVILPRLFSYFTKEELEKMLNNSGFETIYFATIQPGKREYLHFLAIKE